ncbi:hypothetical protein LOTGIDRAFT_173654 [Lottia gigantea]|uniref:Uncharacterized protein n=1 Tax=Lottia gigantea TaxID=225164 RepID=V4AX64_LOTGI|nr:hypothetical protein LOTGIDRAFT_173654 [Lottia gigantea]ESO99645.1 hypothetical protein LOTGIDRAFT_173654 [Lottia gigantea]
MKLLFAKLYDCVLGQRFDHLDGLTLKMKIFSCMFHLPKKERECCDIEELFFDLEVEMEESMCRDLICLDPDKEREYLQNLSDVLLFLLLPKEDFLNKPFRFIMRVRTKEIDWMPYFTQRLVDDFGSHIRLYRRAVDKKKKLPPEERECCDIEELFFDLEVEMEESMCRDLICLDPDKERDGNDEIHEIQGLFSMIFFL